MELHGGVLDEPPYHATTACPPRPEFAVLQRRYLRVFAQLRLFTSLTYSGYVDVRGPCVGQVRPGLPRRVIRCPSLQLPSSSANLHRLGGTVSTVPALIFSVHWRFCWCLLPMAWRRISTSQAKSAPLP